MFPNATIFTSRTHRILLGVLGVFVYAYYCMTLRELGHLQVTASAAQLLVGVWAAGLLVLMVTDDAAGRFATAALSLTKALWCNVGVVLTAVLIPHPMRLLLLVVPLFGLLYTALHLEQRQLIMVTLITWCTYVAGALLLTIVGSAESTAGDAELELQLGLAFSCMLVAMAILSQEVTALRAAFERRREQLNEAMEQLSELAMRDELTGLYNRRYIMDVLSRQKALADRGHPGFTLCYCDLDHFKNVNDRYGHQRGDRVLKEFAEVALGVVRSVDFVARLGGEEFLLVLIGADEDTAQRVAERLCEGTRRMRISPDGSDCSLTVSVGVASYRRGERLEDVIQRSDRALYSAKFSGRDRIELADSVVDA